MKPHAIPEPPAPAGLADRPPPAALPSRAGVAAPPPSPAALSSAQIAAALGISRRTLKKWIRHRVISSERVGWARRYDLERVMEALRSHGQPPPAASSTPTGWSGPAGMAADFEYHILPR